MKRIFEINDNWSDDDGNSSSVQIKFKSKKPKLPKINKNTAESSDKETFLSTDVPSPGRYVRIKPVNDENINENVEGSSAKKKKKSKKVQKKLSNDNAGGEQVTKESEIKSFMTPAVKITEANSTLKLGDKLRENLKGSRFRFLNEQLYTIDGKTAVNIFKDDPEAFAAYHEGCRHQVERWPRNPLDRIIKSIRKLPKQLIIADFGCGEGRLGKSVRQKVYSIDLISVDSSIIASDMANTSLQPKSIDVAVYCLSLMGINLKDFLLECNRVLKNGGLVKIAEIASRFENVNKFVSNVESCGFSLLSKDLKGQFFYYFDFKKIDNISKNAKISEFALKPCLYKKR